MVCHALGIDPVVYHFETDPERNAVRDAAATVIWEEQRQARERD
jgi:hypothetical protein